VRCVCDVCAAHGDRAAVGVDVDAQGSGLREHETHFRMPRVCNGKNPLELVCADSSRKASSCRVRANFLIVFCCRHLRERGLSRRACQRKETCSRVRGQGSVQAFHMPSRGSADGNTPLVYEHQGGSSPGNVSQICLVYACLMMAPIKTGDTRKTRHVANCEGTYLVYIWPHFAKHVEHIWHFTLVPVLRLPLRVQGRTLHWASKMAQCGHWLR